MKNSIYIANLIHEYRNKKIEGIFCDLVPVGEQDLIHIVHLRNEKRNKYFLNQNADVSLEEQKSWFEEYLRRTDDIYWGIWNKAGQMVGTIRLYNIGNDQCEEGSCIINEKYSKEAPYAVEAKFLSTVFAFDELKLNKMINENRIDNKVMNSLSKQIGFQLEKIVEIRGVQFNYFTLLAEKFEREKLLRIINYWKER